MKVLATLASLGLWLLGAIFLLAAAHPDAVAQGKSLPRVLVGLVLLAAGVFLVVLAWRRSPSGAATPPGGPGAPGGQEVPGQISLKPLTCPHCGGQVDASSAKLNAEGTLTVTCGYCKGAFMVQEDPKW